MNHAMQRAFTQARHFLKGEPVLSAAALLSLLTAVWVPPSRAWLDYPDLRVLALLLCLMLTVEGLRGTGLFLYAGRKLLGRVTGTLGLTLVLTGLCFFFSMLITNDVALLTFVPFSITTLTMAKKRHLLVPVIVLQTAAANLGSMLTPVGNPQNLFLYSYFNIPAGKMILVMLPLTLLSLMLLLVWAGLVARRERGRGAADAPGEASLDGAFSKEKMNSRELFLYGLMAVICLLCVARVISWEIMLAAVVLLALGADRTLFLRIDWLLLLTFVFFFIFIGNLQAIPQVGTLLRGMLAEHTLAACILGSQIISNVPAAVLFSGFTTDMVSLLYGVNAGGMGTLIASLASVISFRIYAAAEGADLKKYFLYFTLVNAVFLAVLWAAAGLLKILY